MEKLAYLLWKTESDSETDPFRDRLLSNLPNALAKEGASRLKISVIDSDVALGEKLHLGAHKPDALVSFWLDCCQDRGPAEALLSTVSSRFAGYLVVESHPLRTQAGAKGVGRRMPGFSLVGCIEPKEGVSHAEFATTWESVHRDVAIDTQSTFSYVRNEVVRPLTQDAPAWGGVVEEGFPVEALENPQAFYDAVGDEAKYRKNLKLMMESCDAFLSIQKVDSHPMSEYRFYPD